MQLCRISKNTFALNESDSIVNQKTLLQRTAAQCDFERTQFFIGNGYSGTAFNRPALKQMVDAIRAGMVCAVLIKDISRLGRYLLKIGYYLEHFFLRHDVRFIAVSGGIDSNANSIAFVLLYSIMDEWYERNVSQNDLRKCLATAYEDKVKGAMDDDTFVLLSNQFRRERNELKEDQQRISTEFETALKFQDGLTRFRREVESQIDIRFLTRDIVGQFIDWIAVYPCDRSAHPCTQKIEIHYHFIGKIEEILLSL